MTVAGVALPVLQGSDGLRGTRILLVAALRRDRVLLPVWAVVFAGTAVSSATATEGLYPTEAARLQAATTVNSAPALVALYGPVYDARSLGALALFKLIVLGAAMVGLLAAFLVIRHSRADEEVGRTELLVSGAVGRQAPLLAAVLVGAIAAVAVGALTALGTATAGLDPVDSAALGATWAGCGLAFTGVGAVAAQLPTGARAARGIASASLAVAYAVRAIADTSGPAWLTWLSPVGWAEQVRPFAGNRFSALSLLLALLVTGTAAAFAVGARRDLGAGVLPPRPGPPRGRTRSAFGLAWRLHRWAVAGWAVGFLLGGLVLGNLVTNLDGMLDSPRVREMIQRLGGTRVLTDAFLSTEAGFLALIATAFSLSALARMRAEESSGRLESLLAAGTSRTRWMAGHLAVAAAGTVVLVVTAGLALGTSHAMQSGKAADLGRDLAAMAVRLPAVAVVFAVGALLFGLAGRLTAYAWVVLVGCLVLGELGDLMGLPEAGQRLSPYTHVPALPGAEFALRPVLGLSTLAAVLVAAGVVAFRRRDVLPG